MSDNEIEVDEEVLTIQNEDFLSKYKAAAEIAERVLALVREKCVDGAVIQEICAFGDETVDAECAKVYNKGKIQKGVGFPTCINVNNVVCNFCPMEDEATLSADDFVSIELGAHIDGACATTSAMLTVGSAVMRAEYVAVADSALVAADVMVHTMCPGVKNVSAAPALAKVGECFGTHPVEGLNSYKSSQWVLEETECVPAVIVKDAERSPDEFEIGAYEVYQVSVAMCSGSQRPIPRDVRTTVFRRKPEVHYDLRMKAARNANAEITQNFRSMPFCVRRIKDVRTRAGMGQLVQHEMVEEYPVVEGRPSDIVGMVRATVLVTPNATTQLSGPNLTALVGDKKCDCAEVRAILTHKMNRKKKKSKKKKASA